MEKLEIIYLKELDLQSLEGNPRNEIDEDGVEKLKKLIKEHGFQNPLQVYKEGSRYTILCGNHRFEAGLQLGITEFPCIEYKGTKKKALARAVSDNKSGLWTDWNYPLLKDMIVEIDDGLFSIPDNTGFTQVELDDMFGVVGGDSEVEVDENGLVKIKCNDIDTGIIKDEVEKLLRDKGFGNIKVV